MQNKIFRKGMSLALSLALLCALLLTSGCSGDKDKKALVGEWQTTLDMTDMVVDEMKAGLGSEQDMMSYFDIKDFSMIVRLSFTEDGNYRLYVDQPSLEKSVDNVIATLRNGLVAYLEDLLVEYEMTDYSVDDLMVMLGYDSMDAFMEDVMDKDELMSTMDSVESKGTFEAKDGILYLTEDGETGLEAYELDGDKLTLTGEGVEDSSLMGMYPMVFTKD